MWLFDFKDGYCATDWTKAKRFCCGTSITRMPSVTLYGHIATWAKNPTEDCENWQTWSEVLANRSTDLWGLDYIIFILIALFFSFIAAVMTVYLTSSESVFSSKDAPPALSFTDSPTGASPSLVANMFPSYGTMGHSKPQSRLVHPTVVPSLLLKPKRRNMYFAAGSGVRFSIFSNAHDKP